MTLLDLLHDGFTRNALAAALFAGVACSLVGVVIVTMRLAFLGVCMSHAAFAGALLGLVLGVPPMATALAASILAAGVLGPLSDRGELSPDTAVGMVFSSSLGVGFLLLSLIPGSRAEALSILWGSILSVTRSDIAVLAAVAAAVVLVTTLFFKEIQAVVFDRELAAAVGVPATAVFYGLLMASGLAITASLPSVGGLLVFSLAVNPAAAAYQLTYSLRTMFALAAVLGVLSGWGGIALSCALDLPAGALIIIVSTVIFVAAAILSPKRRIRRTSANA